MRLNYLYLFETLWVQLQYAQTVWPCTWWNCLYLFKTMWVQLQYAQTVSPRMWSNCLYLFETMWMSSTICFIHILLLHQANALPVSLWSFFGTCISRQCLLKLGIESAFNWWWPFWARIHAITRQFTQSVRPCIVNYKNIDRRLQMLDKDYKIPDHGKPSIFVGERQSSALVLLKKSLRSRVINESLHKLRGLIK